MREVKEKSPLKERTGETLKSAPQAAFRRGVDVAFQQLRQELREAAQDGQMEDRYESGKITETADHAVRQAERLAEKALHKQPKARSAPQQEGRTGSNPQHEYPHPQQPAAAPREYPPVSAQPSYPPQSQPQVNRSVRESASPLREKPIPPTSGKQPKMREYTPEAKTPVSPSQHPASRIHENARAATETTPSATECAVHEPAASIKKKSVPCSNAPQPKVRESAQKAEQPVHPTPAALRVPERAQDFTEIHPAPEAARQLYSSVPDHRIRPPQSAQRIQEKAVRIKEKSPPASAFTQTPAIREYTRPYVESAAPQRPVQQRSTPLRQEVHGEISAWDEKQDILGQTIQKLEFAAAAYKRNNRAANQLSQSIAELNARLLALERLRTKGYLAADIYHTQAREIRQQLDKLKTERYSSFESKILTMLEDVRKLKSLIDELEQPLESFEEKLFHEIVTDICINNHDEMTVTLLGGLKFTELI